MATTAPTSEPQSPAPEPSGNRFFEWMRSLDIPRQPGWVGGVCAGIAARLGIDPLIVRGIFVVVAIFGGPALLLYAAAWLLLPDAGNKIHLEEAIHGRFDSPLAGIAALVAVSLLPIGHGFWLPTYDWDGLSGIFGGTIWTLILLGAVIWFIVWIANRSKGLPTPPPATFEGTAPEKPAPDAAPEELAAWRLQQAQFKAEHHRYRNEQAAEANAAARARSREAAAIARAEYNAKRALTKPSTLFTLSVVGLAAIAGALTALIIGGQSPSVDDVAPGLAVALAVLATGIIINGVRGKRSGGASPLAVLVVMTLVIGWSASQVPRFAFSRDLVITPTSQTLPRSPWFIGEGDVRANLSNVFDGAVADGSSQPQFETYVGWGDVEITIPADEYVTVSIETSGDSSVTLPSGDLNEINQGYSGYNGSYGFDRQSYFENYSVPGDTDGAERSLYVHVWVGEGDVTIRRAAVPASTTEEDDK